MPGGELLAVAAGLTTAAILARKRQVAAAWIREHGPLPGPATSKPGTAAVIRSNPQGWASHLLANGNFVRGLDRNRMTRNPPPRVVPHWGVDIGADTGTPAYAVGRGRVLFAGPQNGYGNALHIQLLDEPRSVLYGHMSRIHVRPGQLVMAGYHVADVGATTAGPSGVPPFRIQPHIHFEVHPHSRPRFGTHVERLDPVVWLRRHGIALAGRRRV